MVLWQEHRAAATGAPQAEVAPLQACCQLLLIFMAIFELCWKPPMYINSSCYQWHAFKQASLINPAGTHTIFKGSSDVLFSLQEWKDNEIRKKSMWSKLLRTRDFVQLQAINPIKYFLAWQQFISLTLYITHFSSMCCFDAAEHIPFKKHTPLNQSPTTVSFSL